MRTIRPWWGLGAALLTLLIIGIPTDIIPNPMFGRDVPVRPWELPVLLATAVLTGVYFSLQQEKIAPVMGGSSLALFAVACPVCNKVVLLALGSSGALGIWQPLQPYLAGCLCCSWRLRWGGRGGIRAQKNAAYRSTPHWRND